MSGIIPGIAISYLIGSIPTAYLFGRLLKGVDIRKFGSGNVGATNAFRVLGPIPAIVVLILDILKGYIAVVFLGGFILSAAVENQEIARIILGAAAIAGHNWTIFLKFKGGKGIATSFGVLVGLAVKLAGLKIILGLVVLTWLVVFILSRIVSLSSVLAAISFPLYVVLFKQTKVLISTSIILSLLIILRHRSNIRRFLQGREPKLSFKKQK